MVMGAADLVTTAFSPSDFVAATGPRRPVVVASLCLLLAVGVALIVAMYFRGNVKFAAVIPVIAMSWLNRLLRRVVQRQATSTTTPQESHFSG
jgi:phosphotransferase system  glucose/maltose/N-acetylglucosamine-specific IIC component